MTIEGFWQSDLWRFARRRPAMLFGLAVIIVNLFLAFLGPSIAPYPVEAPSGASLLSPSGAHWFGTDVSGLDIFSRILAAPRVDLTIALISTFIAFIGGVALGVVSGFFAEGERAGRMASALIMRTADVVQAFPMFVFALALVGLSGPSTRNVITALAFLNIPFFLRLTRSAVLQVRSRAFVEAAFCAGNTPMRTAFVHVMPNALAPPRTFFDDHRFFDPAHRRIELRRRRRAAADRRARPDDPGRRPEHDDRAVVDRAVSGSLFGAHGARILTVRGQFARLPRPDEPEIIVAALLEVEGLTVIHRGDRGSRQILDGVGFRLGDGETLGLVGESGSGKSVLLSAVTGLLRPPWRISEGHVRFRGRELVGLSEAEFRRVRGRDLGLALANPRQHLNPILPIGRQLANVVSAHRRCRRAEAVALAVGLLRSVGIPDPARRLTAYPHELSGGMCQRLILALAIAHSPSLMLVDEPTNGLDVTISAQILDLLRNAVRTLHSGLLVVSRDLAVVAHYCERVLVLQNGRVVEESPVRDFFAAPRQPYSRQLLKAAAASRDADRNRSAAEPVPAMLGRTAVISDASPDGAAVLRIDGLVKRFPIRGGKLLTAVNGVSFAIRPGEALGLVGESGSGKTTVGRCVLRLIEPNAGTIRFRGRDVTHLAAGEFRKLRSRLQMVFQDPFDSTDPR